MQPNTGKMRETFSGKYFTSKQTERKFQRYAKGKKVNQPAYALALHAPHPSSVAFQRSGPASCALNHVQLLQPEINHLDLNHKLKVHRKICNSRNGEPKHL